MTETARFLTSGRGPATAVLFAAFFLAAPVLIAAALAVSLVGDAGVSNELRTGLDSVRLAWKARTPSCKALARLCAARNPGRHAI